MRAMRRFFTVIFGIVLLALGGIMLLCVNNASIQDYWLGNLEWLLNDFMIGSITAGVMLLLGLLAVIFGVHSKKQVPYAKVNMGEFGSVQISMAAVDTIVRKAAYAIEGVQQVKTRLKTDNTGISVLIDAEVRSDCSIPDIVTMLQHDVKEQLESIVGIKVHSVKTAITAITPTAKAVTKPIAKADIVYTGTVSPAEPSAAAKEVIIEAEPIAVNAAAEPVASQESLNI